MHAVFLVVIAYMFLSVVYDSFIHGLPFYYVLYALGGMVAGRAFQLARTIRMREEDQVIMEEYGVDRRDRLLLPGR